MTDTASNPERLRDPVLILKHAQQYLEQSRGADKARASLAWHTLGAAVKQIENRCIDTLIGGRAREMGVKCDCLRCEINRQPGVELELLKIAREWKPVPVNAGIPGLAPPDGHWRDGKMAAAGDDEAR